MWNTLTISYEGSTEWRPQMTSQKALKDDDLSKEQFEDDTSLEDEGVNLCLMADTTTKGSGP